MTNHTIVTHHDGWTSRHRGTVIGYTPTRCTPVARAVAEMIEEYNGLVKVQSIKANPRADEFIIVTFE